MMQIRLKKIVETIDKHNEELKKLKKEHNDRLRIQQNIYVLSPSLLN